ncbi:MAG: UPF0149 family protein [Desulfobulbaceae bacterium]
MISKKDEKILRKMLRMATEPEEAFTYDELRGFLFGLAMTPDVLMPGEWLPVVFGEEMITIDSEEEGQRLFDSLIAVVNNLTDRFQNGTLTFPFAQDYPAGEGDIQAVLEWAYGLNEALALREHCWLESRPQSLPDDLTEDEYEQELLTALSVIQGFVDPDEADALFDTKFDETPDRPVRILATLFIMLPTAVDTLLEHGHALEQERRQRLLDEPGYPPTAGRQAPKVGRNDPCPCGSGSGKKYKKCCERKDKIVPIR